MSTSVTVIGAGLAGSEATWQLLKRGFHVKLIEMRPKKQTPAHKTDQFAELVCSNSLRSDDDTINAVGLMHAEMRACDSLIMQAADATKVPAGGALAVNRDEFSAFITKKLREHPNLSFEQKEITTLPDIQSGSVILATGPLTGDKLAGQLKTLTGEDNLHFFDAIAPIVYTETIDMNHAWYQSRYDKGEGTDYLNCPLTKDQYNQFLEALHSGEKVAFHNFEKDIPYFEGCLPVEVMAERGPQTLLFGPMKPVGLSNPFEGGRRPFAVVQLRKENRAGTLMNMVGFQTKLTYGAQTSVWRLIPALKNATFARLGGIHRNTFVRGPKVLDSDLCIKKRPNIRLAGQITGCEGYIESTAIGLLAGLFTAIPNLPPPPAETALGAMLRHITQEAVSDTFQPMNINFGLFPPVETLKNGKKVKGHDRKKLYTDRAKSALATWISQTKSVFG